MTNVCNGCKYSTLLFCEKYKVDCLSMRVTNQRIQVPCAQCAEENGYEKQTEEILKDKKEPVALFRVPEFNMFQMYCAMKRAQEWYPEAFYDGYVISEIYDAFPGCIWNGRTANFGGEIWDRPSIENFRDDVEAQGWTVNLTWNNHLVKGTDVYDRYCNMITDVFHNGKHAITVSSPDLFEYLRNKYPNFRYYQSVIQTEKDNQFVKKADGYEVWLWNRHLNNNWDELLKVPMEDRDKIEFLCNDACTPICNRMKHYNRIDQGILDRINMDDWCNGMDMCTIDHDFMVFNGLRWGTNINYLQIPKYVENGFKRFKLCSRGDDPILCLHKNLKYFVKPQFFDDIFGWCLANQDAPECEMYRQYIEENGGSEYCQGCTKDICDNCKENIPVKCDENE